jgi:hypothetical protein
LISISTIPPVSSFQHLLAAKAGKEQLIPETFYTKKEKREEART